MTTILAVAGLMTIGFLFFAGALHFSNYRQRGTCCTTGLEELEAMRNDPCGTCPRKEADECDGTHEGDEECEFHPGNEDEGTREVHDVKLEVD